MVLSWLCSGVKNLTCPMHMSPVEIDKVTWCFLVSALILLTSVLCSTYAFLTFLCLYVWFFLLMISRFKMAPKGSAEVLLSVFKWKKAVTCLLEKIHVLDQLHSGMKSSAVGHEFNVSKSQEDTSNKFYIFNISMDVTRGSWNKSLGKYLLIPFWWWLYRI